MCRYLISLFALLMLFSVAKAQTDTTQIEPVSKPKSNAKKPPIPLKLQGFKVGTNAFALAMAARDFNKLRIELNTELNISNLYYITVDGGYSDMRSTNRVAQLAGSGTNSFLYINEGFFWRVGMDYNTLAHLLDNEAVFIGFRFGGASFSHVLDYNVDNRYWDFELIPNPNRDRYSVTIRENNLSLSWAEAVAGFKINLGRQGFWQNIYMQPMFRLQFRVSDNSDSAQVLPTDVPGFGKNFSRTHLAFSYNILWQFGK
jgi:hypothetical protein